MKFKIKQFLIFILYNILITNQERLTPLSECTKGRITSYTGWEKGGQCGFESHKNATGSSYLYPVAPNADLFNSSTQCGVCYEIVGPSGAIRARVEDYCPKEDELGLCTGDMYHFNVANNGSSYLMGDGDLANVTFRMVSCGFSGNIRILTDENIDEFTFSFVVLDHNLGISYVTLNEYSTNTYIKLNRDKNNNWIFDPNYEIYYPLTIRIYSINNDYVTVEVPNKQAGKIYEADGNFKIPNNTYFNINTLEKEAIPENAVECCERDKSEFTPIYKNGQISDYYTLSNNQKVTFDYNSSELYQDQGSMKVVFQSLGSLSFKSIFPIRADQYSGLSISIKTKTACTSCLYLRAYDLAKKDQILQLNNENEWKVYRFTFDNLGVENNEFNGLVLNYFKSTSQPLEIYIGNIELIGSRNPPNAGVCVEINNPIIIPITYEDNEDSDISPSEYNSTNNQTDLTDNYTDYYTDNYTNNYTNNSTGNYTDNITSIETYTEILTDNTTEIVSDTLYGNISSIINILSIESMTTFPSIINVKTTPFNRINGENMVLLFTSIDNSNSFQTESCILANIEIISFFSCKMPSIRPDGEYIIKSPSGNKYNINHSNHASIVDGSVIFSQTDNSIETTIKEQNSTQLYSQIIITNSIDQTINKGDTITFQVTPIESEQYSLPNNEIIFTDSTKTKFLYLKNCQEKYSNNMVNSIQCIISNNIMKGNYTTLADNQNIIISPGKTINLVGSISTGGIFSETISQIINTNLTRTQKNNFGLTFNILYYNSNIKPGDLFPHRVYLYGVKASKNKRNLDEIYYNSKILFPNCSAGNYSYEDRNAIGSIRCRAPDYIPAGTYSKLESDGFDTMPNSQINLVFKDDFNRTYSSTSGGVITDNTRKSSSKSKTWIIWLIAGILVAILVGIVIVACILNRKGNSDKSNDDISNNSKGNISQDSKRDKSEESSQI